MKLSTILIILSAVLFSGLLIYSNGIDKGKGESAAKTAAVETAVSFNKDEIQADLEATQAELDRIFESHEKELAVVRSQVVTPEVNTNLIPIEQCFDIPYPEETQEQIRQDLADKIEAILRLP